ncbi:MAG: FxLYD domain-containing protein [Nitrososphaeraceae archaeon]|jgi:hypothetical protein
MPLPPLLVTVILIAVSLSGILLNAKTFAQDQPSVNQLIIQGVNATVPSGRERDIYTITGEGDSYRITGEVLNNDTVRFSSVRVSATLYDNSSQIIGEGSAHTSPSGIPTGMSAPFEINIFSTSILGGIDAIGNFTLEVTGNRQTPLFQ